MKALILVGGFGTRLRPLTLTTPKPAVEFANKPSVVHQIEALQAVGVDHVILAISSTPNQLHFDEIMQKWAQKLGIKISYSRETTPLGTAGPLALARDILFPSDEDPAKQKEPFFVLNADVICTFPFKQLLDFHKNHGGEGTLLTTKVEEPSRFGVILSDKQGKIEQFVEKPQIYVGNTINAGIYIFNKSMLDRIKPEPTSIEKQTFPAMANDGQLYCFGIPEDGFWMDIGQPKDFILGTKRFLAHLFSINSPLLVQEKDKASKEYQVLDPVMIDPTATVAPGCLIGPNVTIGPDCVIEEGVRLKNCVILANCIVKKHSYVDMSIIGWESTIGPWSRIQNRSVLGKDVTIGPEVFLNGVTVLPNKGISNSIADEGTIIM